MTHEPSAEQSAPVFPDGATPAAPPPAVASHPEARGFSGFAVWVLVLLVAVALIGSFVVGHPAAGRAHEGTERGGGTSVDGTARGSPSRRPARLPRPPSSRCRAMHSLTAAPRSTPAINGYLNRWLVDIGDQVEGG